MVKRKKTTTPPTSSVRKQAEILRAELEDLKQKRKELTIVIHDKIRELQAVEDKLW
jgi:hypothetical protein